MWSLLSGAGCPTNPCNNKRKANKLFTQHTKKGHRQHVVQVLHHPVAQPYHGGTVASGQGGHKKILEIPSSFNFIKSKSKETFKLIVKKKIKTYALKMLKLKQQKHSKIANDSYNLLKMQPYFTSMLERKFLVRILS